MSLGVRGVNSRDWILALVIRDDGERLLLGDGAFEFKKGQNHFAADKITNTTVDVQGTNGILLAGQTRKAGTQKFAGYIGDASRSKAEIEALRRKFINFFRENYFYTVVYVFQNRSAIKRQRGFLVNPPEVADLFQIHPEYSVSLTFEDVNYYKYEEDGAGVEQYGQSSTLLLSNAITGGVNWDADGMVWDEKGVVVREGIGGVTTLKIDSVGYIYPVIVIAGQANNPVIENLTTGEKLSYDGVVLAGQTLIIDASKQTAMLNGTNVLQNLRGDWLSLAAGINRVNYATENDNARNAVVKWAEVVA